jgi:exonuclease III
MTNNNINKYKNKYIKYKNKYLDLLNKYSGTLNNNSNDNIKEIAEIKCNEPNKILCSNNTVNLGLCVEKTQDCNDSYIIGSIPKIKIKSDKYKEEYEESVKAGISKGYIDDYLETNCLLNNDNNILTYNYSNTNSNTDLNDSMIPNIFSITTLNVMGIIRNNLDKLILMKLRVNMLVEQILNNDNQPDILCFQEMSKEFFKELYCRIKHKYKFADKQVLDDLDKSKNEDVCTFLISKYTPIRTKFISLTGNLGYTNSLGIYEFDNLVVFNLYLQAGSVSSLGQKYKWKHYSRCRIHELEYVKNILSEYNKPFVIVGDFNFDLNNTEGNIFPEVKYFKNFMKNLNCVDSFKYLHEDLPGYTEDTDINSLRWNDKFEHKQYRYDAIISNNYLLPIESKLFANIPLLLDEENSKIYEKIFVKNKINDTRLKFTKSNNTNLYELFISDHFGVLSKFQFNSI